MPLLPELASFCAACALAGSVRGLCGLAPFLHRETPARLGSSAGALLIVALLRLCSSPSCAASAFLALLASDWALAAALGPPLPLQMQLHHAVAAALTLGGRSLAAQEPAAASPLAQLARASTVQLLSMEASTPLLHLLWLSAKEPCCGLSRALPLAAAAALASFFQLRVLGSGQALLAVWQAGPALFPSPGHWQAAVAAIGCLWGLQVAWFALLCRLVCRQGK